MRACVFNIDALGACMTLKLIIARSLPQTVPVRQFASMNISPVQTSRPSIRRTASVSSTFSDDSFTSDDDSFYVAPSITPLSFDLGLSDIISSPFADDDDSENEQASVPAATIPSLGVPSLGRSSSGLSWLDDAFSGDHVRDENYTVEPTSPFSASWFSQQDLFN